MERSSPRLDVPANLRVLVIAGDGSLADECRDAIQRMSDRTAVFYTAAPGRDAIETARDRQPQFVIADIGRGLDLPDLVRNLNDVAPGAVIAGAYDPNDDRQSTGTAAIIDWVRVGVRDFVRRPVSPVELGLVFDRLFATRPAASPAPTASVISFISNKGGVGKSTLSVNVACALARRHPGQVLLVDASLQLGVCALMLSLTPTATILDAARERERLDEALLRGLSVAHPSGVRLLPAPADVIEAADIGDEAFARILHVARRAFSYVVVDTFPLLDSVVMAALDASDLICVVLQCTAPSVAGMARLLPVLEGLGFPEAKQMVVLNRNHKRFLGDLTTADVEGRLGRAVDVAVPYERGVLVSMNTGEPFALQAHRWNRFGRAIDAIVTRVASLEASQAGPRLDTRAEALRTRIDADRRHGERRVRQVDYAGPDRRSGLDRRDRVSAGHTQLGTEARLA